MGSPKTPSKAGFLGSEANCLLSETFAMRKMSLKAHLRSKVGGSNPSPATSESNHLFLGDFFCFRVMEKFVKTFCDCDQAPTNNNNNKTRMGLNAG